VDTATDNITSMTAAMMPGGHDAAGFGIWINQDCCTSSTWDAAQWQYRSLATPALTNDLVPTVMTPKEIYMDDHTSWNNAQPDRNVPLISSTFRYGTVTTAWRAWDDEILGLETAGGQAGTVWRFAHHRSNIASDSDPRSRTSGTSRSPTCHRMASGCCSRRTGKRRSGGRRRRDGPPGRVPGAVDAAPVAPSIAYEGSRASRGWPFSHLKHQEGTAEIGVARGLRHRGAVTKGVHELRVRDETRRAPSAEAPEGAAHVGVEREQFFFAMLSADAHAIGRVEAEDPRRHRSHRRQ